VVFTEINLWIPVTRAPLTCTRHPPTGILLLRPLLIVNGLRCPTVLRVCISGMRALLQ